MNDNGTELTDARRLSEQQMTDMARVPSEILNSDAASATNMYFEPDQHRKLFCRVLEWITKTLQTS